MRERFLIDPDGAIVAMEVLTRAAGSRTKNLSNPGPIWSAGSGKSGKLVTSNWKESEQDDQVLLFPDLNNLPQSESVAFGTKCKVQLS